MFGWFNQPFWNDKPWQKSISHYHYTLCFCGMPIGNIDSLPCLGYIFLSNPIFWFRTSKKCIKIIQSSKTHGVSRFLIGAAYMGK